jgi:hypothetical protein
MLPRIIVRPQLAVLNRAAQLRKRDGRVKASARRT